ncbi:Protein unc-93 like protein [Argiope bruennichi]|uniref:Protein unc-93 like protein n=1 Tax=Argiope bruennichi TaxID=94029 RepID=A0A8T0G4T4_ARGBR|nr:Protein unc-93 like protein [Argiope bruennichi]
MEKTEGLNFEENCENSLEFSPPIYLPSYKRSESGSEAESNRQCSEKTFEEITEYDQGFEDLNSERITDHKSFDAIQSIKETERDIIELQGIKNIQNNHNQKSKSLSSVNSLFFSLHGFVFCSAQVWSNLISFYVLASGRVDNYDKISNCSCGADFCNTDQVCVDTKIEEVPANIRQYYTGVCFACGILSVLLIWLLVDHLEKSKRRMTLSWNHIFATIKFIRNKEQFLIIPFTICSSMLHAFYVADFTKVC